MTCAPTQTLELFTTREMLRDDASDREFVGYHWACSYAKSWLAQHTRVDRSDAARDTERRRFVEQERPRIEWHLSRLQDTVTLLVDREHADIIYGFACATGDVVHYAMVKRDVARLEHNLNRKLFKMMLGDRLTRPCAYTSQLVDMEMAQVLPRYWYIDGGWYFRERGNECTSSA